ncbi:hypothetical protein ACFWBN_26305 [Streptomyces sp. NPDC059989]
MDDLHVIELEPEVRAWLELLPGKQLVCEREHGPAHTTYGRSEEGDAS